MGTHRISPCPYACAGEIIKMDLNLYRRASDSEDTSAEEALGVYKKLEHENSEFYTSILLAAIIFPTVASVIAFLVSQSISSHRTIATVLILCGIGFLPPSLMFGAKLVEKRERCMGVATGLLELAIMVVYLPIIVIFADIISLAIMSFIAAIITAIILTPVSLVIHILTGAPFLWPTELPTHVYLPIFLVCFVAIFLFAMSNVPLRPIFPVKRILMEIPVGLKVNSSKILEFIASLALGLALIGSGPLGILYEDIRIGVIANGFSGALLGLSFARLESDPVLGNLYRIARARCLMRLGREAEASYRLSSVLAAGNLFLPEATKKLAIALWSVIHDPQVVEKYINEAAKCVSSDDMHVEIYLDNIQKTRRLVAYMH